MGMNEQQISDLKRLMEYEAARTEPPAGFPHLPDLPAGRYTDERFYQLEKEHLWRKSWLFAAHIDEILTRVLHALGKCRPTGHHRSRR